MRTATEPTTEQELDRKIIEARARRVARAARAQRYAYYDDLAVLWTVVGVVVLYVVVAPLVPQNIADRITDVTDAIWRLLPIWLLVATLRRVIAYRSRRRLPQDA